MVMDREQKRAIVIEKWLKILIFWQIIFLFIGQCLLEIDALGPYLNKAILYEGVFLDGNTHSLQTID